MSIRTNKTTQSVYEWQGVNAQGTRVRGQSHAGSVVQLKSELHAQGVTVDHIKRKSSGLISFKRNKISGDDITVFCRQISIMLDAGIPIVETLDALGKDHENPAMQVLIGKIRDDISQGSSMSQAFQHQSKYFDSLFYSLIAVGEQTGNLVLILDNLATYKEKTDAMRRKVKKAMFYPTAIISLSFIVALVLLIFVVPQFEKLFQGFGAELPAFTRVVLDVSGFVQSFWYLIVLAIVGVVYGLKKARQKSPRFLYLTDGYILKLPIIGKIFHYAIVSRLTRTMGISYSAGVPITELLGALPKVSGNAVFANAVLQIRDNVSVGETLCKSMQMLHIFPNIVIQMVAVGESSGSLDKMLAKVANYYETEVDAMVDGLSSLLEPVVMVIIGLIIGSFVAAIYLPIFQLGTLV